MSAPLSIQGIGVGRGVAIGRAVVVASGRAEVEHYFIQPTQVEEEIARVLQARDAAIQEVQLILATLPEDAPQELAALLDVHLLLLQDEGLFNGVRYWIAERFYNASWALSSQFERHERQFNEMDDPYLRERKADLEQVIERVIQRLQAQQQSSEGTQPAWHAKRAGLTQGAENGLSTAQDGMALVLIAHDLSPADMLHFRQDVFIGFATDVGGKNSHTAIVARSMDIPAVVGARNASQRIRDDDLVVIDSDQGAILVNPPQAVLEEYRARQQQAAHECSSLHGLLHTPAVTRDGHQVELLANIELPQDTQAALAAGAAGVGLFRSEFLFMGRKQNLPDEEEQYAAYLQALQGMQGLPLTIRTIDVGADKPLDDAVGNYTPINPALGLRAIRWSLADPAMFLVQLRAILRAAAHGPVQILVPMLTHISEIRQTFTLLDAARQELDGRGADYGPVQVGAMIEVPAAALIAPVFLQYFDFLSIGTNDLTQYTLAIDRADETVAHLYDPLHPAVLQLLAGTIRAAQAAGKPVSVCGEMAGDTAFTRLLLGLGLRSFSMHPAQILAVKQEILHTDTTQLAEWTQCVLSSTEPAALMRQGA